jgi:hypothetical protein
MALLAVIGSLAFSGPHIAAPKRAHRARMAVEDELGVRPPAGFRDVLGFADGGAARLARGRSLELFHCRVSTAAAAGLALDGLHIAPTSAAHPMLAHGLLALLLAPSDAALSPLAGARALAPLARDALFELTPLGAAQLALCVLALALAWYLPAPSTAERIGREISSGRCAMAGCLGVFVAGCATAAAGGALGDAAAHVSGALLSY